MGRDDVLAELLEGAGDKAAAVEAAHVVDGGVHALVERELARERKAARALRARVRLARVARVHRAHVRAQLRLLAEHLAAARERARKLSLVRLHVSARVSTNMPMMKSDERNNNHGMPGEKRQT